MRQHFVGSVVFGVEFESITSDPNIIGKQKP